MALCDYISLSHLNPSLGSDPTTNVDSATKIEDRYKEHQAVTATALPDTFSILTSDIARAKKSQET